MGFNVVPTVLEGVYRWFLVQRRSLLCCVPVHDVGFVIVTKSDREFSEGDEGVKVYFYQCLKVDHSLF
jgi:hypothetical protein